VSSQRSSCTGRIYKKFEVGDEVTPTSKHFKAIAYGKSYIVLSCYNQFPDNKNFWVITILNDKGIISPYGSDRFIKTDSQIREDKIKSIIP
jgi:hypothetical protein